jgi:hypothetical protein
VNCEKQLLLQGNIYTMAKVYEEVQEGILVENHPMAVADTIVVYLRVF